jgi:hypothetical protein
MSTVLNFKNLIDLPEWRPLSPAPLIHRAGHSLCNDIRNNEDSDPHIFYLEATTLYKYNVLNDAWVTCGAHGLTGVTGGAACVFVPHKGPSGTISGVTDLSTIRITIGTLPLGLRANALANNGSRRGYKIRFIRSNTDGLTEERVITSSTAISAGSGEVVITLDEPITAGADAGDLVEILSGQVWMLGSGATGASTWRVWDIATDTITSMSRTNLRASISIDSALVSLSESYVPYNRKPGEGFCVGSATYNTGLLNCLQATGSAAGTITGQTSNGDHGITENMFRNFQIRIVEDVATPAAVGQRRRISSHTGGTTPVYTLASNWSVTPSTDAKYVIEYPGSLILCFTSSSTTTYTYAIDDYNQDTANTWSTTRFGEFTTAIGAGVSAFGSFSLDWTSFNTIKPSLVYLLKGGLTSTIDCLDIAGDANGTWETGATTVAYGNKYTTFTTGTSCSHDAATNDGRYCYINRNGFLNMFRFDMFSRELEPWIPLRSATAASYVGSRLASSLFIDGETKVSFIHCLMSSQALFYSCLLQR